jgi:hypothetical protein
LLSIRVWLGSFVAALIAATLLSMVSETLGVWLFWPIWILLLLAAMFNDDLVLYCPYCRKRVKMGADSCHHCGRPVKGAVQ